MVQCGGKRKIFTWISAIGMSNDIKRMMANCFPRNLFRFTSVYFPLGGLLDRGPIIDSYLEIFFKSINIFRFTESTLHVLRVKLFC